MVEAFNHLSLSKFHQGNTKDKCNETSKDKSKPKVALAAPLMDVVIFASDCHDQTNVGNVGRTAKARSATSKRRAEKCANR